MNGQPEDFLGQLINSLEHRATAGQQDARPEKRKVIGFVRLALEQFKGLVNIARKRHGTMLYKLLNLMLEADPQKRPSFTELTLIM